MASVSPIVRAQRAAGQHPFGSAGVARARIQGQRLGYFGLSSTVSQAQTGIKTGVTAASVTTAIGSGVASAIGAGAAAGSVVPIIGTAIGALVGLAASGLFSHRADPEVSNFNSAAALYNQQGANAALNIANKYLVLAGLFDLEPGQIKGNIPIYKKYGRMGEERFVRDLTATILSCAQTGTINGSDTPVSVYNKCVQPWIDGFGFGPMVDSNAGLIDTILLGMTAEYLAGGQNRWFAVGGQWPFGNLTPFSLPVSQTAAAQPQSSQSGSIVSAIAPTAPVITQTIAPTAVAGTVIHSTDSDAAMLVAPYGTFSFLGQPGAYGVAALNGSATNILAAQMLYDGKSVYAKLPDGSIDVYTANGWTPYQSSAMASTPNVPTLAPAQPAVPAGYSVAGSAFGAPAYQGPDGLYYTVSGNQLYPLNGPLVLGNGSTLTVLNGSPSAPAAPLPSTPVSQTPTSVAIPNGFQLAGNANGVGAYLGPDGLYYSWSGTTMAPLTGALTTLSGQPLTVTAGLPASAANLYPNAASLTTNTQAGTAPYADQLSYPPSYAATATLPAPVTAPVSTAPAQAGLFSGGSNLTLLLGGGILVALFFSMPRKGRGRR